MLSKFWRYEIRLTPQNRVFVTHGELVTFPYLLGGVVRFDLRTFEAPEPVIHALQKILEKQQQIRTEHADDFDEDEAVYRFN